jgi:predicted small lipoprotein YifL
MRTVLRSTLALAALWLPLTACHAGLRAGQ